MNGFNELGSCLILVNASPSLFFSVGLFSSWFLIFLVSPGGVVGFVGIGMCWFMAYMIMTKSDTFAVGVFIKSL